MRTSIFLIIAIVAVGVVGFVQDETPASADEPAIESLVAQLGDEAYTVRERATEALIDRGAEIAPALEAALEKTDDIEIQLRLRYIIENVAAPQEAVLVLRGSPVVDLRSGDIITHLAGRRIRDMSGLYSRLRDNDAGALLRIRRGNTPLEVGPVHLRNLPSLADYRVPNGPVIRDALALYRNGYAEKAAALLDTLDEFTKTELSDAFRGIVYYTAGDGQRGRDLITPAMLNPPEGRFTWTNRSGLDYIGPLTAPLFFEANGFETGSISNRGIEDPDIEVQRIYIPANQLMNAATEAATIWWRDHLSAFEEGEKGPDRIAGNMLAIIAWMLSDLDLISECIELIEPRSAILGSKWVRVHSDGWLDFLAGENEKALRRFWNDAYAILANPPRPTDGRYVTRNPTVATSIGFFLYQAPDETKRAEMTALVADAAFPAATEYLDWMLFGLNAKNATAMREDLAEMLPQFEGAAAARAAFALLLMAYVDPDADRALLESARERLNQLRDPQKRETFVAIAETLAALRDGRFDDAQSTLTNFDGDGIGVDQLRQTVRFLQSRRELPAFRNVADWPLLAVRRGSEWVVVTKDLRVGRFNRENGLTLLPPLTADWYPGVVNWPWLGNSSEHDRAWAYDRRRVFEIADDEAEGPALAINIRPEEIPVFDSLIAPVFPIVAEALAAKPAPEGETSEFLRTDIRANADYVANPDLHDIGAIDAFASAPDFIHVAFRGGPQLLINVAARKVWTSAWLRDQLELDDPLIFFPQANLNNDTLALYLHSSAGLIRFEPATEDVRRIAMPGKVPYPFMIPESCPYERADPRWVYTARLPADGGAVYRVATADETVEPLALVNVIQPPTFYRLRSRAELRSQLSVEFRENGLPPLQEFIDDAVNRVARWQRSMGQ